MRYSSKQVLLTKVKEARASNLIMKPGGAFIWRLEYSNWWFLGIEVVGVKLVIVWKVIQLHLSLQWRARKIVLWFTPSSKTSSLLQFENCHNSSKSPSSPLQAPSPFHQSSPLTFLHKLPTIIRLFFFIRPLLKVNFQGF